MLDNNEVRESIFDIVDTQFKFMLEEDVESIHSTTTKSGRQINWLRCMRSELQELVDEFKWKHWKPEEPCDMDNIIMECSDVLYTLIAQLTQVYKEDDSTDIAYRIMGTAYFDEWVRGARSLNPREEPLNILEDVFRTGFDMSTLEGIERLIEFMKEQGISFETFVKYSRGKSVLADLRRSYGYLIGTYNKTWDGVNDTTVLTNLLREKDFDFSKVMLRADLEQKYAKIGE